MIKSMPLATLCDQDITLNDYTISCADNTLMIQGETTFIYGLGERFDQVNQLGKSVESKVIEKFCNQGNKTYFPLPFMMLEKNLGIFIDTKEIIKFELNDPIIIDVTNLNKTTQIHFFTGSYKEIIQSFIKETAYPLHPPLWALGPWISAHRWNTQTLIEEQLTTMKSINIPVTALVIEQWSDEATFYVFNGAKYDIKEKGLTYSDFTFNENSPWPDPKAMIDRLHQENIKILLWQAPIVKALEAHEQENPQHTFDTSYLVDHDLVVKQDNKPYRIPKGHWFPESYVPDFTNPETIKWWFDKRQYLLDLGIDGYKTDGGEFIHSLDTSFSDGSTGKTMINDYARLYIDVYHNHLNKDQVLFSRSGYTGQQANTILWAGDQKSTWNEFRSIYNAGLSASLSGQHLWGFDIGGFAGDLPSFELYVRATQLAVFTPIMQCHSEPIGGQFALLDPSEVLNNERTPWNIAKHHGEEAHLKKLIELYYLRMHLLPTIYSALHIAIENQETLMKHLMVDFDEEPVKLIDNQHMFGELIVVPILNESALKQSFYLPKGHWINLFNHHRYEGGLTHTEQVELFDMLVFIQEGKALLIQGQDLFSPIDNTLAFDQLNAWLYGHKGQQRFTIKDYDFTISWTNNQYHIEGDYPDTLNVVFR